MIFLLLTISILTILTSVYLWHRNNKVHAFGLYVIDLCYKYNLRRIDMDLPTDGYERFHDRLPTYDTLVISFIPLKLESFFTDEEIVELLGEVALK